MGSEKVNLFIRDQIYGSKVKPFVSFNSPLVTQHWCLDCGDKFIFKSSYIHHMTRQSIKITYNCKICGTKIQLSNRCALLCHIRSHSQISQTIMLSDIQINLIDHCALTSEPWNIDDVETTISTETFIKLKEANMIDSSDIDILPFKMPSETYTATTCNAEQSSQCRVDNIIKDIHKDFETAFQELKQVSPPMDIFNVNSLSENANLNLENHIETVPETTSLDNECLVSDESGSSIELDAGIVSAANEAINNTPSNSNDLCLFCQHEYGTNLSTRKKNRRKHYQQSRDIFSCKQCKLHFLNECAYKAHQSIHTLEPPFVCSECGLIFHSSHIYYKHLVTTCFYLARSVLSQCSENQCDVFFYEHFIAHFMDEHIEVYAKCSVCAAVFPDQSLLTNHYIEKHQSISEGILFHVCNPCSETFDSKCAIENHIKKIHKKNIKKHNYCYICYGCKSLHFPLSELKAHIANCSLYYNSKYKKSFQDLISMNNRTSDSTIIQRQCPNCKLFAFKMKISNSNSADLFPCLNCTFKTDMTGLNKKYLKKITSVLKPKKRSNENLGNSLIAKKRRKNKKFKEIVENKDSSTRSGIMLSPSKSPEKEDLLCAKCNFTSKEKAIFMEHVAAHRDISSNYQCMDCGLGFVTKQSLASHLIIVHAISDTEKYIVDNNCLNDNAENSPKLEENQCEVCLDIFKSPADLDKHFRTHGMAFIMAKQKHKHNSQT